jgi:ABC-type sugar transport system substrate-binding protein
LESVVAAVDGHFYHREITMNIWKFGLSGLALTGALITGASAGGIAGAPAPFDKGGVKIALVSYLSQGDYFEAYEAGVARQAKALGVDLRIFQGKQDAAQQREQIEQAISLGVQGIIVSHGQPEALKDVVQKALDAGIKVVAKDTNTATSVASQTSAALRANPDIKVVFAPYDEFARGVKLGATEAGIADKIKIYSADISTSDIQDIREKGSPWVATSATNPAVVGEVSVRALALSIAGQDPGKLIEVKPFLITQDELNKNDIKTIQDLDAKLPGFGHSDQATAPWLPDTRTQ